MPLETSSRCSRESLLGNFFQMFLGSSSRCSLEAPPDVINPSTSQNPPWPASPLWSYRWSSTYAHSFNGWTNNGIEKWGLWQSLHPEIKIGALGVFRMVATSRGSRDHQMLLASMSQVNGGGERLDSLNGHEIHLTTATMAKKLIKLGMTHWTALLSDRHSCPDSGL